MQRFKAQVYISTLLTGLFCGNHAAKICHIKKGVDCKESRAIIKLSGDSVGSVLKGTCGIRGFLSLLSFRFLFIFSPNDTSSETCKKLTTQRENLDNGSIISQVNNILGG